MDPSTKVIIALALSGMLWACNQTPTEAPQPTQDQEPKAPPMLKTEAPEPILKNAPGAKPKEEGLLEDPGAENSPKVTRAVAVMEPTHGHHVHGTVTFTQKPGGGIQVTADVTGLARGKHAYHIHQFGDCSGDDGKTAGTHFNFAGSSDHPEKDIHRITGNLGELVADARGRATASATIPTASLQGPFSLIGRAVIIHEKANDPSKPPIGAAGPRIACGVIGVADASTKTAKTGTTPMHRHGG